MERLRSFFCFNSSTPSVFLPISTIFNKLPSRFWHKAKGYAAFGAKQAAKREGLVSLSKDKELCEGYADIETMWQMISFNLFQRYS
ncbi:Ribonuclease HII [Bienertia sinuspersici]